MPVAQRDSESSESRLLHIWREAAGAGPVESSGEDCKWLGEIESLLDQPVCPEPVRTASEVARSAAYRAAEGDLLGAPRPPFTSKSAMFSLVNVLHAQTRTVPLVFWLGVLLATAGGWLLHTHWGIPASFLPTAVCPLLTSVSLIVAYGDGAGTLMLLERTGGASPMVQAFGRIGLAALYNLVLGGLLVLLGGNGHGFLAGLTWLAPLAFLTLISLTASLYWGESAGLATALGVWSTQLLLRLALRYPSLLALPGEAGWEYAQGLSLLGAVLCAVAVWRRYSLGHNWDLVSGPGGKGGHNRDA